MSGIVEITEEETVVVIPEQDSVLVTIVSGEQGPPGRPGPDGEASTVPGPPGPPGPPGNTIRYGTTDPIITTGYDGDFYINTTTNFLFGPKQSSTWPPGVSLVGPQGIQGPQGIAGIQGIQGLQGIPGNTLLYGAVNPTPSDGVNGNFYINTATNFIYGPKAGGVWPTGTSMIGPQGDVGPQGPQGIVGTATCIVSDTPPVGAADGALWFESDTGLLYFRFNDGSSTQWVIAAPQPDISTFISNLPQSFTTAQQAQARKNIAAAPFDAMSYSGMQVNGGMEIAQEPIGSINSGWVADAWVVTIGKGLAARSTDVPPGIGMSIKLTVTTAAPTLAAADLAMLYQGVEGFRIARLGWGKPSPQPLSVAFWSKIHRPGTYTFNVGNNDQTRVYLATFTQNVADTWEYKTITIPGCPDGVWNNASVGRGLYFGFTMAAGTNLSGTADTWADSGAKYGVIGQTNGIAALTDTFQIAGVMLLPGIEVPSQERSPLLIRPADEEMPLCLRQYQRLSGSRINGQQQSPSSLLLNGALWTLMRVSPTIYLVKTSFSTASFECMVASGWYAANPATLAQTPSSSSGTVVFAIGGFSGLPSGGAVTFNTLQDIIVLDARV